MSARVGEHTFDCHSVTGLAPLRAEPRHEAAQVTEAFPGAPLEVVETRGGWARVRTAYGYLGWLGADALGGAPDPAWLEPQAGEPLAYAHVAFWLGDGRILHSTGRDGAGVIEEPEPAELRRRRRALFSL